MRAADRPCPESITGHDRGRDGHCLFCGVRLGPPEPRPTRFNTGPTELDIWYGRMYDPDYGSRREDV
jgi:hypothetical protein